VHLKPPGRCGGVEPLVERDEAHSQCVQFLKNSEQMLKVATQAVEPPADHDVDLTAPGRSEELVQRRTTILRPRDAIDIQRWFPPTAALDVPAQLLQLVLRILIERAYAGVQRWPQGILLLAAVSR
jgi:hypothetical protein